MRCTVAHLRLPRAALNTHVPALAAVHEEPTHGEGPQVKRSADRFGVFLAAVFSEAIFRV